ncbi:SigE family RNA polymerase sigma factor [Actinoplanes sp. NPDC051470]|uniref:SigE family RNA polymerase sigma factor n=1 Tax=Actinoplanes sp. NPDC051470 TaxID=3157224 RepID=UPI0034335954
MRAEWEREYVDYATAGMERLKRLAYTLCGDVHHASDLVQGTLVRLYERWPRVRGVEHVDAYVHKMLLRQFLAERRRPWSRIRLGATVPETPAPERADDDRPILVAALRRLPPRQRAVLVLRFLYDLPVGEVAAMLGCGEGTVKSQTSRGLATMRRLMDADQPILRS